MGKLGPIEAGEERDERLREVLRSSPAILFTLGVSRGEITGITWISENVFDLTGYSAESAVGDRWWLQHTHADDLDRVLATTLSELLESGRTEQEFRFRLANGEYRWTRSVIRLVRDEAGRVVEAAGVWCDIDARRRAEEERERLRGQLQKVRTLDSLSRLSGGVAHDFNNLLTVINGYAALLLKRTPSGDPAHECLREIRTAGERAAALSHKLLMLSRKSVVEPTRVCLNDVVSEAQQLLGRAVAEGVRVEISLDPELGATMGDRALLHEALMNLAANARDAMPEGGVLRIETSNVELAKAEADALGLGAGQYIRLTVTDTGWGIPEAVKPYLFEPFFTTKETGQGTGLGLAMVYGIVRQCGGSIEVTSEVGMGSRFTIHLPRAAAGRLPGMEPRSASEAPGSGVVLLVEDQGQVRKITEHILREAGYQVIECAHPAEAMAQARNFPGEIRVILTDVAMPDMNGLELVKAVRTLRPKIKALFMSGHSNCDGVDAAGIEAEGGYIAKPFSPDGLRARVAASLETRPEMHTVLVVDDEQPVRTLLREILSEAGYRVTEAQNGVEAIRQLRAGPVDLMITDLSMPDQEGLETIRILHRELPQLKMIAISGRFPRPLLRAAEMFGASASLSKPVDPKELIETVARVIAKPLQ